MLFIGGVLAVDPPECIASPDSGSTILLSGIVDPALTGVYTANLLVGNQLVPKASSTQVRTETARVSVEGTEVHVLTVNGGTIREYTVPASGDIGPGTGQDPGYGVVGTNLLQPLDAFLGYTEVVADVQVYGKTLGGQSVQSNWFTFPIHIGPRGWLVDYPAEAVTNGRCTGEAEESTRPCFLGQDGLTSCTACRGLAEECSYVPAGN